MKQFGLLITRTVFFLVLFILIVRVAMHKNAFESFVFAVALAVGLTPEFLPMISSVTLARGAVRMARKQVVVKRLPGDSKFRHHRHFLQRQNRNAHHRPDDSQLVGRLSRTRIRQAACPRLHQQQIRNRHSQSARRRDPKNRPRPTLTPTPNATKFLSISIAAGSRW